MKLNNPFPDEVRWLFAGVWKCWLGGCNGQDRGGLEIHHIYGRVSDSAFNASVLCGKCHGHVGHSLEEHRGLFLTTLHYLRDLANRGIFQVSPKDVAFLRYIGDDIKEIDLKL